MADAERAQRFYTATVAAQTSDHGPFPPRVLAWREAYYASPSIFHASKLTDAAGLATRTPSPRSPRPLR